METGRVMKPVIYLRAASLYACALLLLCSALHAQQYTFRQYGPSDGLTNLGVNCLLQDHAGYLWVGTDNGLFRYDGSTFQPFGHAEGLEDTEIRSLAESPEGVLWVATQNGVDRRVGSRFEPVDAGVKGLFLAIAFDPNGNLYLEHATGILRGQPGSRGAYRFNMVAPGSIGGMFVHGQDVWFRRDGDLWRLTGDKTEQVGLPAGLPKDRWGSITLDTAGNLWVRSATRLYERPHAQARFIDRSEGIPPAQVTRLFADAHGRLLVSTSSGVVMLDGPNRTYIDPQHGLPSDVAGSVLVDREESLWIGMRGGGLVRRLGHGEWLSWKKADGLLNDSVWSAVHARDGRLWVGTNGGLSVFAPDGKLAHSWNSHSGLNGDSVYALAVAPSGQVFAGTAPAGITRFSSEGQLLRSYGAASGLISDQVNAIAFDRQNRLWIAAASGGCFRSTTPVSVSGDLKFERIPVEGVASDAYFYDIRMDEAGVMWIATTNGLVRFDGSRWRVFTKSDGLRSSDLVSIALGHNEIWVAYRDALGIARLRFHGDQVDVTNITKQDGLSSDFIYALAFDHAGRLWVTTDNGVNVMEQGHWRSYGTEDGLIWDDGNDHALSIDSQDNVWIGTARGLSRYAAPPYPIPDPPSAAVLTSIHGVVQEFQAQERPVLSHAQDSLLIQFSGLNYSSETRTRYRYRLLGYKTAWTDTREKSVHFEGLPSGSYTFEVVAAGPNGLWSLAPARFAFSVKPPWWLSWWFLTACVIVALLLARALWRYRVRALVAQKNFLEQQVIDRTAELRESHRQLEAIAYYDVLTSLPNRRMFTEQFRSRLAVSRRHGHSFALLLIDLDSFKQTNDSFGHDAGDAVLVETAALLLAAVRESDCVARLGGDEFAILLVSPTDLAGIESVCKRIVDGFLAGFPFKGGTLKAGCSIGAAVYPSNGDSQESLYKCADIALYEAKRMGGNNYCHYRLDQAGELKSGEPRDS
jgi:diguanylate cyclase (GGDEF)-like protein